MSPPGSRPRVAPPPLLLVGAARVVERLVQEQGQLGAGALTRVHDRGVSRLVIDLAGVNFIDSVSVASLVNTQRRLRDGRFALVVPEESYGMLIFQAGGIESVLPIFETRDQAIAHARS